MQGNASSPVTDFTYWASIGLRYPAKDQQKIKLFPLERTCSPFSDYKIQIWQYHILQVISPE